MLCYLSHDIEIKTMKCLFERISVNLLDLLHFLTTYYFVTRAMEIFCSINLFYWRINVAHWPYIKIMNREATMIYLSNSLLWDIMIIQFVSGSNKTIHFKVIWNKYILKFKIYKIYCGLNYAHFLMCIVHLNFSFLQRIFLNVSSIFLKLACV